jgi:acetyl-CoA C-acetyltransferase
MAVDIQRKGETIRFEQDEEPFNVKFEKIPLLKPSFQKDGTVTAANASSMNDGAAAMILVSEEKLKQLGLKPGQDSILCRCEQSPEWFTTSPAIAVPRAVHKAGLKMEDISYWELNEAFSVVGIENSRRMQLDPSTVNIHGGAVALGHPLGCSGARILVTLLYILQEQKARWSGRNM